jgi:hypothetical protein
LFMILNSTSNAFSTIYVTSSKNVSSVLILLMTYASCMEAGYIFVISSKVSVI